MSQPVTEVFLIRNGANGADSLEVLLGRKKRGVGAGKLVGIGGKVEPGETPAQAAARELREEVCVEVAHDDLDFRGVADFRFPNKPAWCMVAHVFVVSRWRGEPTETAEIAPGWFALDAIPFDDMWADARVWLRDVLLGGRADIVITYNDDNTTIRSAQRAG